jgi:hypothetical protein
MRRWIRQIRAFELSGEKNRLGRGSDLGHVGGNLCLWGPERFFSVVRNADCTYSLFGRTIFKTMDSHEWQCLKGMMSRNPPLRQEAAYELEDTALVAKREQELPLEVISSIRA